MAIVTTTFTVNLASVGTDEYVYTSAFGAAFKLGCVTLAVKTSTVDQSNGITVGQTPVIQGIQENFEIWIDSVAGADYDCKIQAASFNGQKYVIWSPPNGQNYFIPNGSNIRVVIKNAHKFGSIFGTITVETP